MSNHFRPPHLPQTHVGGWFLRNFISLFHQFSCPKCTRTIPEKNLPPTKRACGQVGKLKLLRLNDRRYKNLLFNYLQKFKRFPSAETKRGRPCGTIKLLMFNYFRPPQLPQTHVGGSRFFRQPSVHERKVKPSINLQRVVAEQIKQSPQRHLMMLQFAQLSIN